jgi:hypothetical protein
VHVQGAPVVQVEELMLSPALHSLDARTMQRARRTRRKALAQRWMEELKPVDGAAARDALEQPARGFHLGKLRHARGKD